MFRNVARRRDPALDTGAVAAVRWFAAYTVN